MSRVAPVAFAVLVAATVGAFFVTQRLKRTPPVVQSVQRSPVFSPNGDGRKDVGRLSFRLKRDDDVTVSIVDADGSSVRGLADSRPVRAYRRLSLQWDGRTDEGARAPDGLYRARVGLRHQGRSVLIPGSMRLDVTPPRPVVTSVAPDIFPERGRGSIGIRFRGTTRYPPEFLVYRTDVPRPRLVARIPGRRGQSDAVWDGRIEGRRAPPGTYLAAVRVRDRAGNEGTAPARLPPGRGPVSGHPGVTIRWVGVTPPLEPVRGGERVTFFVDARRRRYRWSVRRLGAPRPVKRGTATRARLGMTAPGGVSGVFLLEARAGHHTTRVPFAVQSRTPARVLLVLPTLTWQGRNPVDDDQDGLPNTLERVAPVRLVRPFAGDGLPSFFPDREAPLLVHLDRMGLRYDVTTDLALAAGRGPALRGRPGVLLAGDVRWAPRALLRRLRSYVRGGGTLATVGIDSLRREVRLTPRRLVDPTAAAATDVLGLRPRPLRSLQRELLAFPQDRIQLFFGTDGRFAGFRLAEEAAALGAGTRLMAGAGEEVRRPAIVAYRLGRGLVVRFGLPEWSRRLSRDPNVAAVMRRTWTLLSR